MIANVNCAWTDTADPAVPPVVIVGFALLVAVVAALWRRKLPAGLGEGLLAAAVSVGTIMAVAFDPAGHLHPVPLGHALTGLAIVWYALGRVSARAPAPIGDDPGRAERLARAEVFALAGLICGLTAFVTCTLARDRFASGSQWSPAATDYVLLLVLACAVWAFRTGGWAPVPATGLLVWLVIAALPADAAWLAPQRWRVVLPAVGGGLLALVVGVVVLRWFARRRAWLRRPQVVPDFPAPGLGLVVPVAVVGVAVGIFGLRFPALAGSGPAMLLAGVAALVMGHWAARVGVGALGLTLVGAGIVASCLAWGVPGWNGGVLGLALAAGYLLWLARFWQQQLADGRPWTTAGRLVPAARILAWTGAGGAFVCAASAIAAAEAPPSLWADGLTVAFALVAMSLFVRDSAAQGAGGSAVAALLLGSSAAVSGGRLLGVATGVALWPPAVWTAVVSLLALRIALAGGCRPGRHVYRGLLGGALPIAILAAISWHGFDGQALATLVLAAAALVVAFMPARDPAGDAVAPPAGASPVSAEERGCDQM